MTNAASTDPEGGTTSKSAKAAAKPKRKTSRSSKKPSPSKKASSSDPVLVVPAEAEGPPAEKPPAKKRRKTTTTTATKKGAKTSSTKAATTAAQALENARPTAPAITHLLVVDNGGDALKYGWIQNNPNTKNDEEQQQPATSSTILCKRLPNVTARLKHQLTILVGDEVEAMAQSNPSQMYGVTRSTERGIITNMGNQVQVWKRMLDQLGVVVRLDSEASQAFGWNVPTKRATKKVKQAAVAAAATTTNADAETKAQAIIPASFVAVLLLVPPHCPRVILDQIMYVWMEDFGIGSVGFATSQVVATKPHADFLTGCVVDLGWSATIIVPTFRGSIIPPGARKAALNGDATTNSGTEGNTNNKEQQVATTPSSSLSTIRRLPLGGRQLVNIWKYYTSYRQWNLMDQEWIMRDIFQQLAFVSLDFTGDILLGRRTPQGRRSYDRNFVLPDYQTTFQGQVELTDQLKRLQQEQQEADAKEEQQLRDEAEDDEDEDFDNANPQQDIEEENEHDDMDEDDGENDADSDAKVDESADEKDAKQKKRKRRKSSKSKKRNKRKTDDEDEEDDDADEDDEDEDDNKDLMRQRLLRQKQEEERRRRELEAEQQVLASVSLYLRFSSRRRMQTYPLRWQVYRTLLFKASWPVPNIFNPPSSVPFNSSEALRSCQT